MNKYKKFQERRSQNNYDMKLIKENNKMSQMEQMIMDMEFQETQLLERLKNSQQLEQEQFSRLEGAIQDSNDAYERRKFEMDQITKVHPNTS